MLLNRVSLRHETFVIERAGRKIAVLTGFDSGHPTSLVANSSQEGKLDLRDIAGVGQEIWRSIDVDHYIKQERSEWK